MSAAVESASQAPPSSCCPATQLPYVRVPAEYGALSSPSLLFIGGVDKVSLKLGVKQKRIVILSYQKLILAEQDGPIRRAVKMYSIAKLFWKRVRKSGSKAEEDPGAPVTLQVLLLMPSEKDLLLVFNDCDDASREEGAEATGFNFISVVSRVRGVQQSLGSDKDLCAPQEGVEIWNGSEELQPHVSILDVATEPYKIVLDKLGAKASFRFGGGGVAGSSSALLSHRGDESYLGSPSSPSTRSRPNSLPPEMLPASCIGGGGSASDRQRSLSRRLPAAVAAASSSRRTPSNSEHSASSSDHHSSNRAGVAAAVRVVLAATGPTPPPPPTAAPVDPAAQRTETRRFTAVPGGVVGRPAAAARTFVGEEEVCGLSMPAHEPQPSPPLVAPAATLEVEDAASQTRLQQGDDAASQTTPQHGDNAASQTTPQHGDNAASQTTPQHGDNAASQTTTQHGDNAASQTTLQESDDAASQTKLEEVKGCGWEAALGAGEETARATLAAAEADASAALLAQRRVEGARVRARAAGAEREMLMVEAMLHRCLFDVLEEESSQRGALRRLEAWAGGRQRAAEAAAAAAALEARRVAAEAAVLREEAEGRAGVVAARAEAAAAAAAAAAEAAAAEAAEAEKAAAPPGTPPSQASRQLQQPLLPAPEGGSGGGGGGDASLFILSPSVDSLSRSLHDVLSGSTNALRTWEEVARRGIEAGEEAERPDARPLSPRELLFASEVTLSVPLDSPRTDGCDPCDTSSLLSNTLLLHAVPLLADAAALALAAVAEAEAAERALLVARAAAEVAAAAAAQPPPLPPPTVVLMVSECTFSMPRGPVAAAKASVSPAAASAPAPAEVVVVAVDDECESELSYVGDDSSMETAQWCSLRKAGGQSAASAASPQALPSHHRRSPPPLLRPSAQHGQRGGSGSRMHSVHSVGSSNTGGGGGGRLSFGRDSAAASSGVPTCCGRGTGFVEELLALGLAEEEVKGLTGRLSVRAPEHLGSVTVLELAQYVDARNIRLVLGAFGFQEGATAGDVCVKGVGSRRLVGGRWGAGSGGE